MSHQVTVEEISSCVFEHQVAGSFGLGINKQIKQIVTGNKLTYRVIQGSKVVTETPHLDVAVDTYNSI